MISGEVKFFNNEKGFGFVHASGKDYFIHFRDIDNEGFKTLTKGEKVSFIPEESPRGLVAKKLIKL